MDNKFIEINSGNSVALVSISSIAMVEQNGSGSTIIMKELNKDGKNFIIITSTSYFSIRAELETKRI